MVLEKGVRSLAEATQGAVDGVVGLLILGQLHTFGFLGREAEEMGFALVSQVSQCQAAVLHPVCHPLQKNGIRSGRGGVMFAAGSGPGAPQWPSVRGDRT